MVKSMDMVHKRQRQTGLSEKARKERYNLWTIDSLGIPD